MSSNSSDIHVTIDFGTNNSRYSFRDPRTGSTEKFQTSTVVLFTPQEEFHSFGKEAEDTYRETARTLEVEVDEWYLFEKFKMVVHEKKEVTRDMLLLDYTKKKGLPAMKVFSAGLAFLKDHVLQSMRKLGVDTSEAEIKWAVTVPGFWEDKAKSFMREAAEMAGLPGETLQLVLESEAAAVSFMVKNKDALLSKPGTQFHVQDIGGGKTDVSTFECKEGNRLRQVHRSKGDSIGGNKANEKFKEFLLELVGVDVFFSIKTHEMKALMDAFEEAKRSKTTTGEMAVRMPESIQLAMDDAISDNEDFNGQVRIEGDKLILNRSLSESFMAQPAEFVSKIIQEVKDQEEVKPVDTVCLVGGESENPVIKETVQRELPQSEVVVPPEPAEQTLTGAVEFVNNSEIITTRISAYTYGVGTRSLFEFGVHEVARLVVGEEGEMWCKGCFSAHITIDQEVEVNTLLPDKTYTPVRSDQTAMDIVIYRSTRKEPLYVDEEGSEKIGSIRVLMPDTTGGMEREVNAAMRVGGTELTLEAIDKKTQKKYTTKCDFLSK